MIKYITKILLKNKQCVFMWPKDIGQRFKDINEMCMYFDIDCITEQFILDNTFCGLKGIVKLKQIKSSLSESLFSWLEANIVLVILLD